MRLEVWGPLIFWSLMFAVGAAIKFSTFQDSGVFYDIAPEAALWATGILFSLSVSEQAYFGVRLVPRYKRHVSRSGFSLSYEVTLPQDPNFGPRFVYIFLVGMAIWIFCLLLSGYGASQPAASQSWWAIVSTLLSYFLAALLVGAALRCLYEVTR